MYKEHPLKKLVALQKNGIGAGICSVCSSHPYVIDAAIEKALQEGSYLLIESTANQVNQYGGYTGMSPQDFADYVYSCTQKKGLPKEMVILGGDHLGPLVWKDETEESAMEKAEVLIACFVSAGFTKIHIDTSMHLGTDIKENKLDIEVIARRAARLCAVAEKTFAEKKEKGDAFFHPVYVIGSEVPIPGGSQEEEVLSWKRTGYKTRKKIQLF